MTERNAAVGYAALKKQSSVDTAVTPNVYTPYYKQNLITEANIMEDTPVYGNRFRTYQHLRGIRSHKGQIVVMAEPDTAGYWFDMLLNRSATSGANPYTHTFGLSNTTDPNSYTLDISLGSQVVRFWGIQASNVNIAWEDEKMQFEVDVSGLGSFYGREIASISTTAVTFKTEYDAVPTKGLVANDLVKIVSADGSTITNFTIVSVDDDDTVTLSATAAAFAAGDTLVLRPATPSLSIKRPFLWGLTRFFFAADAATALTNSATVSNQTRLEPGTELSLNWEFESEDGSKRSGAFDPASLIRTVGDYGFKVKKPFDTPEDIKSWNALEKKACVIKSFSGSTNQYELRVTLNNMTMLTMPPETESAMTIYSEQEFGGNYDSSDSKGMEVTIINAVATI